MIKKAIGFILVGICLGVTGVYVYWCLSLSKQVNQNTTTISQIVQYLNGQIEKTNPMANTQSK